MTVREALQQEWDAFLVDRNEAGKWTQMGAWRRDNPGEWQKLQDYRAGTGPRPTLLTKFGLQMVEHVDAWLLTEEDPPPPPPPPPGLLRWKPPGWNGGDVLNPASFPGYVVVDRFEQCTDNTKDYYVRPHTVNVVANKTSGRTQAASINGGRNVVAFACDITADSQSAADDALGLIVEQGAGIGEVYLEGCKITAPNLITGRSQRNMTMQSCAGNARAVNDIHGSIHPDVFQEWRRSTDGRHGWRRFHRCTFGSTMTFVNDFTDETTTDGRQAPLYFEIHDSDFHSLPPLDGTPPLIGLACWMGSPGVTTWKGTNVWWETSYEDSGRRRNLGDMLRYYGEQYNPKYAGYQIVDSAGTVLYTQEPNIASGAPGDIGRLQGHKLRYHRDPLMTIQWTCQTPPSSFAVNPGRNYEPLGYA